MTAKDCLFYVKSMKDIYFPEIEDKKAFIDKMEEPIKGLIYGKSVMRQLRGMILGGNIEGAEKFLRKAIFRSKYWPYSELSFKSMGGVMWVIFLMLAVSTVFLILGVRTTGLAKDSFYWPQTEGVILKSNYYKAENKDDDGDVWVSWMPVIEYRYEVNKRSYYSKQINFRQSPRFEDSLQAKDLCNSYPKNSKATVYYNPNKHRVAVLQQGLETRFHIFTVIGIGILGITVFAFIMSVIVVVYNIRDDYADE